LSGFGADTNNATTLSLSATTKVTNDENSDLLGASSIGIDVDKIGIDVDKIYVTASGGTITSFDLDLHKLDGETAVSGGQLLGLGGAADSAVEREFGGDPAHEIRGQRFLVTAGSGANALVTFQIVGKNLQPDQGPDANNLDGRGLGDGDPTGRVQGVQSLAVNPVPSGIDVQTFYTVSPDNNSMYVLQQDASGKTSVVQLLKQGIDDVSGLTGAAAVTVSPDGIVYVAATGEVVNGARGAVSVYERVPLTDDQNRQFDGLRFVAKVGTSVFDAAGNNPFTTLTISPDGNHVYVSGPRGLAVFSRNGNELPSTRQTLTRAVADLTFLPDGSRAYGVEPSTNKLLVFDVAGGMLTVNQEHNVRLDAPRSVEVSPALHGANGELIPAGRFVYVASAGNNSISVFDEFDANDQTIDGNLHHIQIVREGVAGTRGLEGVRTIQLSAEIADSKLAFTDADVDAETSTITTELPHGLLTGQAVWFELDTDAPGISATNADDQPDGYYYVRKIDNFSFQLASSETEARSGNGLIRITAASDSDGKFALHTTIPAGAFLYALGYDANAIAVFQRDSDPFSPTVGQLTFMQVIRNRIGNTTGGANDGLFQPNSIVAPTNDTSAVFVGSAFDPVPPDAPGGFVKLKNNPHFSPALPAVQLNVSFGNMASLSVITGAGDDNITVHTAPNSDGPDEPTIYAHAIPLDFQTGDGFDSLTLNDAAADITGNLGAGEDTFTLRTTHRDDIPQNTPLTISIDTGSESDKIIVEKVGPNQLVNIVSNISPGDDVQVDSSGIDASSMVTIDVSMNDTVTVKGRATELPERLSLTSNSDEPDFELKNVVFGDPVTAAATVQPNPVPEGLGGEFFTLDASGSTWSAPSAGNQVTIQYAWDMNGDGLFTELVSENAIINLTWDDLVDFGFADADVIDSFERRLPLRVTRIEKDATGKEVARDFSDTEIPVIVKDVLPTLFVVGDDTVEMKLNGDAYALTLSATDPGNDQIVSWTVNWGDGTTDNFGSDPFPTHFYDHPGSYTIEVTAVDDDENLVGTVDADGNNARPKTKIVNVTFASAAVSAGGDYTILEGHGVTLTGDALGLPDQGSYAWKVNGSAAGNGKMLDLTWADLNNAGIVNDGVFDVTLSVTYNKDLANLVTVTSSLAKLTVQNVLPTANFTNSGPVGQGSAATVRFTNVIDAVDVNNLTYQYDFGSGFVVGSATQAVPASVTNLAGSHVITGRVYDSVTTFSEFQTTLQVDDLPPVLNINRNQRQLVVKEGSPASLSGTFQNPGGGPVTLTAIDGQGTPIGTITQANGTWQFTLTPDDGPGASQTITVKATDGEGTSTEVSFQLLVLNVAPTIASFPSVTVTEGGQTTVTLSGFQDVSPADADAGFNISLKFGDGNGFVSVAQNVRAGGSVTVPVPDTVLVDNGAFTVRARIADKDGGISEFVTVVNVNNAAPQISSVFNVVSSPIGENQTVTVVGEFIDLGSVDSHLVQIDWGDGSTDFSGSPDSHISVEEIAPANAGDPTKYKVTATHRYLDDALTTTPTGSDIFLINVKITDDDDEVVNQTLTATVQNVAPFIAVPLIVDASVNEGGIATLQVRVNDVGPLDTHVVTIKWGDGQTDTVVTGGRHVIDFETDLLNNPLSAGVGVINQFQAIGGGFTVSTGEGTNAVLFNSSHPTSPIAEVANGGIGYAIDVPVSGGHGNGMRVDITQIDPTTGAIEAFDVAVSGSGYRENDIVTVESGNRNAKLVIGADGLPAVRPVTQGSGYAVDVPVSGGKGNGLRVDITKVDSEGAILEFVITDPGSDYVDGDVVTVLAGDRNATLTLVKAGDMDLGTPTLKNVLRVASSDDPGGQLTFTFDQLVRIDSIDLLDVDQPGGQIQLFDADDALIQTTLIHLAGNNSMQRVFINQQKLVNNQLTLVPAKRMVIRLADKAALARLDYTEFSTLARIDGTDENAGRSFTIRHQYVDEDRSGEDTYKIDVVAIDDDGGRDAASTEITVRYGDFGDAPAPYPTLLTDNGAFHLVSSDLYLGASVNSDADGTPDATATSDLSDDGVVLPSTLIARLDATVIVTVSGESGKLDAWIDFNRDGDWDDVGERITPKTGLPVSAGLNSVTFTVPAGAVAGTTFARFRLSTIGGLDPTGPALDGEVEDYSAKIITPAPLSARLLDDPVNPGKKVLVVVGTSQNDGLHIHPQQLKIPDSLNPRKFLVVPGIRVTRGGTVLGDFPAAAVTRIVVHGLEGNDTIFLRSIDKPATLYGGEGHDVLIGGNGHDRLVGGEGNDKLEGGRGNDELFGEDGNDWLNGSDGDDVLVGGKGNDNLDGGRGNDKLFGEAGNDWLNGGDGDDVLVGGAGDDRLLGETGRNVLIGGNGADSLGGGRGDDLLIAGYTDYDANIAALMSVLNEWARTDLPSATSYATRVGHLRGTMPSGLNGAVLLKTGIGGTVHDDSPSKNTLMGSVGRDWFFARMSGPTTDRLLARIDRGSLYEELDRI
jgi:hypothetical protein